MFFVFTYSPFFHMFEEEGTPAPEAPAEGGATEEQAPQGETPAA